jgi:hypothetical protein
MLGSLGRKAGGVVKMFSAGPFSDVLTSHNSGTSMAIAINNNNTSCRALVKRCWGRGRADGAITDVGVPPA